MSKAGCERIQRPIWTLIKNKIGLAKSAPNSMCSHIKILDLRTIWQNQLAHHITELAIRLNRHDEVGITTRLRLEEAQLKCMSTKSVFNSNFANKDIKLKYNLAFKVMCEGSNVGFSFQV